MALNIKSAETDRLARELAAATGETITEAVTRALRERLDRKKVDRAARFARAMAICEESAALPVLDDRPADEILGYNENGTWD